MQSTEVKCYLENIESFKFYIEHIIESIRNDDYNIEYVKKLSNFIKNYYDSVNCNSDSNDYPDYCTDHENIEFIDASFIDNNEPSSDEDLYGFNNEKKNDYSYNSESSNKDDDNDDDNNNDTSKLNKNNDNISLPKINKKSKNRLDNFLQNLFPDDEILLYKKDPDYINRINNFNKFSKLY